jgi:hypothetical protein
MRENRRNHLPSSGEAAQEGEPTTCCGGTLGFQGHTHALGALRQHLSESAVVVMRRHHGRHRHDTTGSAHHRRRRDLASPYLDLALRLGLGSNNRVKRWWVGERERRGSGRRGGGLKVSRGGEVRRRHQRRVGWEEREPEGKEREGRRRDVISRRRVDARAK